MSNDRLLELISRKLAGEATEEELEELKNLLAVDGDAAANNEVLQQYWDEHDNANQFFVEEAFEKIVPRLNLPAEAPVVDIRSKRPKSNRKPFQRVALVAGLFLLAGTIFILSRSVQVGFSNKETALVEKENSKGVKSTIELSDGSKIWLNADSRIQFPKVFSGDTREVYLNGEAFFEVTKIPSRPFIIHLANGTVRVLGTSFNIRAYDNEKLIETSVATGKVAFIPKYVKSGKKQDTVFLTPEKKVRYLYTEEHAVLEATVSKEDRAWIAGKLTFKAMTFEEIGVQLERNFGKKIIFASESPKTFRLTGSFQNNSLDEILFYLSKSKRFHYEITNSEVLISDAATEQPNSNN